MKIKHRNNKKYKNKKHKLKKTLARQIFVDLLAVHWVCSTGHSAAIPINGNKALLDIKVKNTKKKTPMQIQIQKNTNTDANTKNHKYRYKPNKTQIQIQIESICGARVGGASSP